MTMTKNARRTVLILGANGRFGLAAAQAFDAAGWRVLAALRRAPEPGMPTGVKRLNTPIEQAHELAREAAGADIVVHALNPAYTRWSTELLPTARAGMAIAEALGARFMLPGNVYNFGASMPAQLAEGTPQRAATRKGALRIALEAEIEQRCADGPLRATIVRAGDFYGGGSGNWFDQAIVKQISSGKLVYPGPTDVPHAWAYLPDLARAFVALASRSAGGCGRFERFHFAGHTLTGAELLAGIERAAASLGIEPSRPWRHATLPWAVIRIGGLLVPVWRELAEMSYLWRVPHALKGGALEGAIGPASFTPLADALRASLHALTPAPRLSTHSNAA
jgi:nucleoside-diphosphate-sugar epimerase